MSSLFILKTKKNPFKIEKNRALLLELNFFEEGGSFQNLLLPSPFN
jgi:hypothetical protein